VGVSLYTALPFSIAGGTHEVFRSGNHCREPAALREQSTSRLLQGRFQNFLAALPFPRTPAWGFTATGGTTVTSISRAGCWGSIFG
jgi:hypothetical protein